MQFILSDTYYHNMVLSDSTVTVCHVRDLLWVLYLPVEQRVNSMTVHSLCVSVSHLRLLKWETPTFISPDLWLQHPNGLQHFYKNSTAGLSQKIHNVNWPTLWYSCHGFEQRIIDNDTDDWCKRLWVSVHVKKTIFSIQFDCRFYICTFKCVSLVKITSKLILLCWILPDFHHFYISQGSVATQLSYGEKW